jgi:diaminohydroxyphosphoribosylaminopyrimidine deaminase/5-amino-6-(5-phosphoribosylamino)uracil reductase
VVGTGFHERAGRRTPRCTLRAAGARARGATLYCTLEPCSHTGRTGPCAVAVADAGIRRVVAAMQDPYPEVAGRGFAYLRDHGVDVEIGVREAEARRLNEVFVTNVVARRPFVVAKIAISLDNAVAAAPGARTTSAARPHSGTRSASGRGGGHRHRLGTLLPTIRADGARRVAGAAADPRRVRSPAADAADGAHLRHPCRRARAGGDHAGPAPPPRAGRGLARRGLTLIAGADDVFGAPFSDLLGYGVTSLLLEGGPALHAAAWTAGVVDRVRCYVSPVTLGAGGVPWTMPPTFGLAALGPTRAEPLGDDVLIEADVHRTH